MYLCVSVYLSKCCQRILIKCSGSITYETRKKCLNCELLGPTAGRQRNPRASNFVHPTYMLHPLKNPLPNLTREVITGREICLGVGALHKLGRGFRPINRGWNRSVPVEGMCSNESRSFVDYPDVFTQVIARTSNYSTIDIWFIESECFFVNRSASFLLPRYLYANDATAWSPRL